MSNVMKYFSKGKRGKIYLRKDVAIKMGLNKHIKNEVKWLKRLNKYNIGPKLISYKNNYFKYKFVNGKFILDFIKENNKNKIKKILIDILKQCRTLDELKVNKLELHNPYKHIIINKKPVMIDFERCYKTNKPKNVTQFCHFLISKKVRMLLKNKNILINKRSFIKLLKIYKKSYEEERFKKLLRLLAK